MSTEISQEEHGWIELARQGDAPAVTAIYRAHQAPIRAFAQRLLGDWDSAEDLVQELFIRLPRFLRNFQHNGSLRTFLLGCASNLARTHLRSALRRRASAQRTQSLRPPSSVPPDAQLIRSQQAHALSHALDELPLRQRLAFILVVIEQRSHAEACRVLDIPEATVRTRCFHARKKLQKTLRGQTL